MQYSTNIKRWGKYFLIFSFLYILIGVVGYLSGLPIRLSVPSIVVALAGFFTAFQMYAKKEQPILRLTICICLATAVFLQGISFRTYVPKIVSYIIGILLLIFAIIDFYKRSAKKQINKQVL